MAADISQLDTIAVDGGPHSDQSTRLAKSEERKFSGDHRRREQKKNARHWLSVGFMWVVGILVSTLLWARALHYILPESWCWLSEQRLHLMDEIFFHGTIGGLLVGFVKACLSAEDERAAEKD